MKRILIMILILTLSMSGIIYAEERIEPDKPVISNPSDWAKDSVSDFFFFREFSNSLSIKGYQSEITRGDFIYLASKTYEIITNTEIEKDASIAFTDTNDKFVIKGASIGITNGIGNNLFGYDDKITREQLATLTIKMLKLANKELIIANDYIFNDESDFSSWAKESIYLAKSNNFVNGVGEDKFNPKGNATIEQAITIITKIINQYELDIDESKDFTKIQKLESIINSYSTVESYGIASTRLSVNIDKSVAFTIGYNPLTDILSLSSYRSPKEDMDALLKELLTEIVDSEIADTVMKELNTRDSDKAYSLQKTPSGNYSYLAPPKEYLPFFGYHSYYNMYFYPKDYNFNSYDLVGNEELRTHLEGLTSEGIEYNLNSDALMVGQAAFINEKYSNFLLKMNTSVPYGENGFLADNGLYACVERKSSSQDKIFEIVLNSIWNEDGAEIYKVWMESDEEDVLINELSYAKNGTAYMIYKHYSTQTDFDLYIKLP